MRGQFVTVADPLSVKYGWTRVLTPEISLHIVSISFYLTSGCSKQAAPEVIRFRSFIAWNHEKPGTMGKLFARFLTCVVRNDAMKTE